MENDEIPNDTTTIGKYIERFRKNAPTSRSKRNPIGKRKQTTKNKEFWWISSTIVSSEEEEPTPITKRKLHRQRRVSTKKTNAKTSEPTVENMDKENSLDFSSDFFDAKEPTDILHSPVANSHFDLERSDLDADVGEKDFKKIADQVDHNLLGKEARLEEIELNAVNLPKEDDEYFNNVIVNPVFPELERQPLLEDPEVIINRLRIRLGLVDQSVAKTRQMDQFQQQKPFGKERNDEVLKLHVNPTSSFYSNHEEINLKEWKEELLPVTQLEPAIRNNVSGEEILQHPTGGFDVSLTSMESAAKEPLKKKDLYIDTKQYKGDFMNSNIISPDKKVFEQWADEKKGEKEIDSPQNRFSNDTDCVFSKYCDDIEEDSAKLESRKYQEPRSNLVAEEKSASWDSRSNMELDEQHSHRNNVKSNPQPKNEKPVKRRKKFYVMQKFLSSHQSLKKVDINETANKLAIHTNSDRDEIHEKYEKKDQVKDIIKKDCVIKIDELVESVVSAWHAEKEELTASVNKKLINLQEKPATIKTKEAVNLMPGNIVDQKAPFDKVDHNLQLQQTTPLISHQSSTIFLDGNVDNSKKVTVCQKSINDQIAISTDKAVVKDEVRDWSDDSDNEKEFEDDSIVRMLRWRIHQCKLALRKKEKRV